MKDPKPPAQMARVCALILIFLPCCLTSSAASVRQPGVFKPEIPRTWDEQALAALEVPAPDPKFSPVAVPSEYYYRVPVRPIYKSYAVYGPGTEPPGYMDTLKRAEPVILWDDKGAKPRLESE